MPIKLIATDMDGTLLNSRHELSPRSEAALRAALAQGVKVVIATGRSRSTIAVEVKRWLHPSIRRAEPVLGCLWYQKRLSPQLTRRLFRILEDYREGRRAAGLNLIERLMAPISIDVSAAAVYPQLVFILQASDR